MKKSIRRQIIVSFLGLFLFVILLIVLVNAGFIESYYLNHKKNIMVNCYEQIAKDTERNSEDDFWQFASVNNLSVLVIDWNGTTIYTNLRNQDYRLLQVRLFGYLYNLDNSNNRILEKTSDYTIQCSSDESAGMDYIELWGELADGKCFLVRSPLASIKESISISNRFYLMIAVAACVIGGIFIAFFSRRMTRPIIELTELSQKMANLDFEARYTSGGEDEIGILGNNFNQMSEILEKTIAELKSANNELQKDIEKKEQIDEMRKEFLSNVSHELKTPIALIQGYAEGLQDNINDDPESREFYCEVIIDEANKMNQMVKKLLTLNQLEFGNEQISMERFDLTELIRGVMQSSSLLAEQAEAKLFFWQEEPLYVWGDEFHVEEVLTNYITNAIHYAKYDKKIDIRCVKDGNTIKTIVFNTGDTIPEEELDKIWIKFYKVDKARTREYGGNGIGLSIVKAIMDSMNQQCGVKNFDNGVAFWFTLEDGRFEKEGKNTDDNGCGL